MEEEHNAELNSYPETSIGEEATNDIPNVPTSQHEESQSIHDGHDGSATPGSAVESTLEHALSVSTYSSDSHRMDLPGKMEDISKNRFTGSLEVGDPKDLRHENSQNIHEGDTKTKLNINSEPQNSEDYDDDDRMDISICPTSQTESSETQEDDDEMEISISPTSQDEVEEISKADDREEISDVIINIRSQSTKSSKDDRTDDSENSTSQIKIEQDFSDKNQNPTSKEDEAEIPMTSTSPPAEPSGDNLITRPTKKADKDGANTGHPGASVISPEEAVSYIRRCRKEITAALQKDIKDFLDECDSRDIITQEEYFKVDNLGDEKDKARALVNLILQKGGEACRAFLQCVQLNQEEENIPEVKKSDTKETQEENPDKDKFSTKDSEEIQLSGENPRDESKEKDKRMCFQELLKKIEFEGHQISKLTLNHVLGIGAECLAPDDSPRRHGAWYFIRKLMMLHEEARNISTIGDRVERSRGEHFLQDTDSDMSEDIHPLDLQCAIFHCSDHFLQQEMTSKMSMCQFSVPLLLPASDGPDCTFMLWVMRNIVKKWRPQSLAESKGFREEHLVKISMPTFSFVRLGRCRLSKSKILNQILSTTQHVQDVFVHRDMEGGNVERTISLGLVEMSWYFPAGKGVFTEPVAFTNLRGELENNVKPFSFLAEISSIVVIFAAAIDKTQCELLLKYKKPTTRYLFIIAPEERKSKIEMAEMLESVMTMTGTEMDNVLVIAKTTNEATTVKKIRSALLTLKEETLTVLSIEDMAQKAREHGICVDESAEQCKAAERKAKAITEEIHDVVQYKKRTMILQDELLKDLAREEKELCQMKQQHNKNGEKYKSELRRKCDDIRREQRECEMPTGIIHFIEGIGTTNRAEKFYFLSWLKYYLDLAARKTLPSLQEQYKELYSKAKDSQELREIDQRISDSSLGVEHFIREVSQFYEVWKFFGPNNNVRHVECNYLPETAADLLLDGYPLELIDGDASRIPVHWVTDVLNQVNSKTNGRSRIRVITVLGVQSTGKSTLLNTMFGLQFPVASGRCTRGAFMTLIKVKENFHKDLGCEFLLVIDTEGLKAPELDSLEGSYEHDNELATLVVGLSDITVINMAMENMTEMKDILQIVVHAFLRMKEIGKKPNCQFVHQNVSDVSAPVMNMRDRNKLLEQLNEMTKTVATMEKKPQYKLFCDVMEYDSEQHHWYIPSLWQGVPPMAPVSVGYSEHIDELKQNLLKLIKQNQKRAQTIPEFIKWMEDLWNAVKHENFIFSFRNSLVASAYNKLSMKYSELGWKFEKLVHEWFINTETIIKNQSEETLEDKGTQCCTRLENIVSKEQNKLITWVEEYYKQDKDCAHLIRYKGDFINSAKMLGQSLKMSSYDKYNNAMQMKKQQLKINEVCSQYIKEIEGKVSGLMEECRKKRNQLGQAELKEAFENMWQDTVNGLGAKPLTKRDIEKDMLLELTKSMRDKGSAVNEKLNHIKHLPRPEEKQSGGRVSAVRTFFKGAYRWWKGSPKHEYRFQPVLQKCCKYSKKQAARDGDYDNTYCKSLLNMIDDNLKEELNITAEQELDIKTKILGRAVVYFQEMHDNFRRKNDPSSQLETLKSDYFKTFMNVFEEKNESLNLSKRICDICLKPAITDHIIRNLGVELVDDILQSKGSETYTSRTFFQYYVLLTLLEANDLQNYVEYSRDYKEFVKNWILNYIKEKYHNLGTIERKILAGITKKIRDLLNNPEMWDHSSNVQDFLLDFQEELSSDLVLPQEKMKAIVFKNSANKEEFISNLNNFLNDTEEEIKSELDGLDMDDILSKVTVNPQEELFKKVFGCGKQCPFCKVPCEAGGEDHKEHFASVHRPQGLGRYRWITSSVLCHDICTTCVNGNGSFINRDTKDQPHPFKNYRDYYPDWKIQPDPSIEASDYWKFILKEFNKQFADEYEAKPAEYPEEWNHLTKEMAKESLKKTFNM
ncbi:interferon-induced very large GTPase 1-like isoform X2 [Engystomops pustulosus]|uniref:interferon-induced very large GTPase 1-like isoform X2 n=1 Tax=Engystomops pustulosus TaxID=76066 RepID=UPI003AFA7D16